MPNNTVSAGHLPGRIQHELLIPCTLYSMVPPVVTVPLISLLLTRVRARARQLVFPKNPNDNFDGWCHAFLISVWLDLLQSRRLHHPARSERWHLFHHQQRTGEFSFFFFPFCFLTMTHKHKHKPLRPGEQEWEREKDTKSSVCHWDDYLQDFYKTGAHQQLFFSPQFVTRWSVPSGWATPFVSGPRFCNYLD